MEYITQGKLLRIIQEKKVMRLGSDRIIPIDVRIIAATNKNLKSLINENKFRVDLYYRLNVLQHRLPPLRNRKEDIKLLTEYTWPGNIRELQNII